MFRIGKPLYKSDGQYLEKLQTPSAPAQVSVKSERMDIMLVLDFQYNLDINNDNLHLVIVLQVQC